MASSLDALSNWYGDQMRKEVGNALWTYEHALAKYLKNDPDLQYRAYDALRQNVELFPCDKCSNHGLDWIDENPFDPSEEKFADYVSRFHNDVNQRIGKPVYNIKDNKFHQELEVGTRHEVTEVNEKTGEEDVIVESVPYSSFDIGLSFPISPLPGSPAINISTGQDWPFTALPLPRKFIRDLSGPWFPPLDDLPGMDNNIKLAEEEYLKTPAQILKDVYKEK
jgi:Erv1 / Alr family